MSKTKGNVVDPLETIDEIGADAMRHALVIGTSPGNDQRLTKAKLDGGRNFTNKLWNAARFVVGAMPEPLAPSEGEPTLAERWIGSRLAEATERATRQLDELEISAYVASAQDFAWTDYCDWYLEMAKVDLRRPGATDGERARAWRAASGTLATILQLLHPIMPFVTEEIWGRLASATGERSTLLINAPWPSIGSRDLAAEAEMSSLIELIRAVRNLRTESGAPAGTRLPLTVVPADARARAGFERGLAYLVALARVEPIDLRAPGDEQNRPERLASTVDAAAWLGERAAAGTVAPVRQAAAAEQVKASIERLRTLLAGEFATRAPAAVVERERARLADLEAQLRLLLGG
jgi:valyl-tRNA synthetase